MEALVRAKLLWVMRSASVAGEDSPRGLLLESAGINKGVDV